MKMNPLWAILLLGGVVANYINLNGMARLIWVPGSTAADSFIEEVDDSAGRRSPQLPPGQ